MSRLKPLFCSLLILVHFMNAPYTWAEDAAPGPTPTALSDDVRHAVDDNAKYDEGLDNARKIMMPFQYILPVLLIAQFLAMSQFFQHSPECHASTAVQIIMVFTAASVALRIASMVLSIKNMKKVLDEMDEAVFNPDIKDGKEKDIDHIKFYTLMLNEYQEIQRNALYELIASSYDLLVNGIIMILSGWEVASAWTGGNCVPKPLIPAAP